MVHTKARGSTLVFWKQMEVDKKHAAVTVGWRLPIEVRDWSQNCRNLPVRHGGSILFASSTVVHRPTRRFDSLLHFDIRNIWQIHTQKQNGSAQRLPLADLVCEPERWQK